MSTLDSLKSSTSLGDLANLLQFKPSALSYVLYRLPATQKYKVFEIPKRNGGKRTIKAPVDALKLLQQRLSVVLQDCVDEINVATGRKDQIAHGFKRKRSIITNARQHRNRRFVFNIDLEDFFPSINFGRVRGFFIKDKNFALSPAVATVIAKIACDDNALPQGSPCSPVISNLIAHLLDMHLVKLASSAGCTYSRYADDLTFSTNKKAFPTQIARPSEAEPHVWVPSAGLQKVVALGGFKINSAKTHMQYRDSRQEVTGLVVNKRINARREYRHTIRAMVHTLLKTGSFNAYTGTTKAGVPAFEKKDGTTNQLHGMLGFVDSVDLYNKKHALDSQAPGWVSGRELIYRRFLIYKNFFATELPVVLCEGETDNVYLTHAIRGLAAEFPALAAIAPNGKILLNLRLYKYRKSSTGRILGLRDGGSSCLASFIAMYKKETQSFLGPGKKHPVVVLFDNDSGAKGIRNAVKQASGKQLDEKEQFANVVNNLYVVPTPLLNGAKESKIEDFFDAKIKATVVNGKTFDDKNDFETANHYGKKVFAHKVVVPNASAIDFGQFRPLLTTLAAVINLHAPATSAASAAVPGN